MVSTQEMVDKTMTLGIKEEAKRHKLTLIGDKAEQVLCLPSPHHQVSAYLIEILLSRPKHFLRPEWIRDSNRSFLIYDKTAYMSLEEVFLSNQMQRDDLFYFMWQSLQCLELCEDALLESKQLILDPQFIYFKRSLAHETKPLSFDPQFIFVPVEEIDTQVLTGIESAQLAELFEYCIDRSERHELLLEEEISMLRQLVMGDSQRLQAWLEDKSLNPQKPKRRKTINSKSERVSTRSKADTKKQDTDDTKPVIRPETVQQIITVSNIILLLLMNISLSLAMREESFFYYGLTAVGLFLLVLSQVYLYRQNRNKQSTSDTRFERERRLEALQVLESEDRWKKYDSIFTEAAASEKKPKLEDTQVAYLYAYHSRQAIDIDSIDRSELKRPAAVILNREFYIGADRDRCDFRPNCEQLSPLHARITNQDGSYVLCDLASDAGSYLNNIRLHYYEDYLLYSGAVLRFADSSFLFIIEEANTK